MAIVSSAPLGDGKVIWPDSKANTPLSVTQWAAVSTLRPVPRRTPVQPTIKFSWLSNRWPTPLYIPADLSYREWLGSAAVVSSAVGASIGPAIDARDTAMERASVPTNVNKMYI